MSDQRPTFTENSDERWFKVARFASLEETGYSAMQCKMHNFSRCSSVSSSTTSAISDFVAPPVDKLWVDFVA